MIRQQLNRLRTREHLLQCLWAAARWLPVVILVLALTCLTDWLIDLRRDTPYGLRVALLVGQLLFWSLAVTWIGGALSRRYSDAEVALWVEDKMPAFGHRLISAVQLNQPGADTRGMSPELIAAVTRQAEEKVTMTDFAQLADPRRIGWSAALLAPVALGLLLVLVLIPDTARALLARLFLSDRDIPRSVALASENRDLVWPAGEPVVLRFRATGDGLGDDARGEVRVDPDGGRPSESYELVFESKDDAGATFVAKVPATSTDFTCLAWLKDGRTRQPGRVHFEPRPVVERLEAAVMLPDYIVREDGRLYGEPMKGADIVHRLPKCRAHVAVTAQKPLTQATLEILGPAVENADGRTETVLDSVPMTLNAEDPRQAEGVFALHPSQTGYRVVVRDRFGFENLDRPRRAIRTAPLDPPLVTLLMESVWRSTDAGTPEDREIEGIPIRLGQRFHLDYLCAHPYGLSHARLRYRVLKKGTDDESAPPAEESFLPLPLGAPRGTAPATEEARREFELFRSDPDKVRGTHGRGAYDFNSTSVADGKGNYFPLEVGDRIQYYVEVFSKADPNGQPGRSAIREKEVVSDKDFLAWLQKKDDQKERIRQLEEKQRGQASRTPPIRPDRPSTGGRTTPPVRIPDRPTTPVGNLVFGRGWRLLGVFPSAGKESLGKAYPPETEPTDLAKQYAGLKGKIGWQEYHSPDDKIDLQKFFSHGDAGVAYAVCWVHCDKRAAILSTGSDDGIKVWIDRKLVLDKVTTRDAFPGDDKTPVELTAGWHEVLVKVDNRFGTWAFYLQLEDPRTDKPLEGLTTRLAPPTDEGQRFVRHWQVMGPFWRPEDLGLSQTYAPEKDPINLAKELDGRDGKVRWTPYRAEDDGKIDFVKAFGLKPDNAEGIAYAVCWVRCDRQYLAHLLTGSDDGIRVVLNRQRVVDKKGVMRQAEPGSDKTAVLLAEGWNEVLVKVDNKADSWAFFLELRDARTGRPLEGVEFRLIPPE
jgi:hypothetical protein